MRADGLRLLASHEGSNAPRSVRAPAKRGDAASAGDLPRAEVLLLEDNLGDACLVEHRLRGVYDVTHAETLQSALRLTQTFAVVLLDLGLPDAQGLEAVGALREKFPDAVIVVLTGIDSEQVASAAAHEGVEDYLVKDEVSSAGLVRAIKYAMERRTSRILRRRLYHADRLASVGQLAAGVAHEVNNPSAFLLHNSEAGIALVEELEQELSSTSTHSPSRTAELLPRIAELREIFHDNVEGVQRIRSVVTDLGLFSRIVEDDIEVIRLDSLIQAACNLTRNEVRHVATLRVDAGPVPDFTGHPGRITQLLVNLILNATHAIEAAPGDSHVISVNSRFDPEERTVVLEVRDTGCGIPKQSLSNVFDPFFTTKPPGQGTGLGLSLCSDIVRQHGGSIAAQSALGRGTLFRVRLPLRSVENSLASRSSRPASGAFAARSLRVLVIDDEPAVRRALRRVLSRSHDLTTCGSGKEALELLSRDAAFDAVLCDLMMPDMDGVALYRALEAEWPELASHLVFLTGGAVTEKAREFASKQRVRLLSKPASADQLRAALEKAARP